MRKILYRLFVIILLIFALQFEVRADVMPYRVSSINSSSIGVYQAANDFTVYAEPSEESEILFHTGWNTNDYVCEQIPASNLFVAFAQKKNLAFLTVIDESEDEKWVQISFKKNGEQYGWIKKTEDFKYMNWRTFFNLYGRKYGMYFLKDSPETTKVIYSSNDENSPQQTLGTIEMPQLIKLQTVSGNWLLAVITEMDKSQKIGWLKWRSVNGEIYMFPNLK